MNIKKFLVILAFFVAPLSVFATSQTMDSNPSMDSLLQQVSALQEVVKSLQAKLNSFVSSGGFNSQHFPGYLSSSTPGISSPGTNPLNSYCQAIKKIQGQIMQGTATVVDLQNAINAALAAGVDCGSNNAAASTTQGSMNGSWQNLGNPNPYCQAIKKIQGQIMQGTATVVDLQNAINAALAAGVNCGGDNSSATTTSDTAHSSFEENPSRIPLGQICKNIQYIQGQIVQGTATVADLQKAINAALAAGIDCGTDGRDNKATGTSQFTSGSENGGQVNGNTYLSVGSRGQEITNIQGKLQQLGYFPKDISPSGYFGEVTKKAIINFQTANNLPTTGLFGPMTSKALNGANVQTQN